MAISLQGSAVNETDSATSLDITLNAGTSDNRIIVCSGCTYPDEDTPSGVTYNSQSLTKLGEIASGSGDPIDGSLWYRIAPSTGSNTCTVTFPTSAEAGFGAAVFYGVDQATGVRDYAEGQDNSSPYQLADTSLTVGDERVSTLSYFSPNGTEGTPAETELWEVGHSAYLATNNAQYSTLASTSHTAQFTSTYADYFILQAVSLIPASAGTDDEVIDAIPRGIMRGTMRGTVC